MLVLLGGRLSYLRMSSTYYSGTAGLARVLPFPAQTAGPDNFAADGLRRFDLTASGLERTMDFGVLVLIVRLTPRIAMWGHEATGAMVTDQEATMAAIAFGLVAVLLLDRSGEYRRCLSLLAVRETERLLRTTATACLLTTALLAMVTKRVPWGMIVLAAVLIPLALALEKKLTQAIIRVIRKSTGVERKAVIVGTGELGRRIFSTLVRSPKLGIDPVALVRSESLVEEPVIFENSYQRNRQAKVLTGPVTAKMLRMLGASLVILADRDLTSEETSDIRAEADSVNAVTCVIPEPFEEDCGVTEYIELDGVMLAYRAKRRERPLQEAAKRVVDVAVSAVSLTFLSPVLAAAAMAVKLNSHGPVIFRQMRVGRNGARFEMFKFRTMHMDCAAYARSPVSGKDPRITRVGRFLRHTCIDELPQLINVLRGEMSLVGPRPEMPFIVESYEAVHRQRLTVKPGITGLWQLSADRRAPIHQNISYDLYWIQDCVEGLTRLLASHYHAPLNLGTEELVTIDQLVDMTCKIAGKRLHKVHALEKPQGVRGRNSDNSRLRVVLGWEPKTPLSHGLEVTYRWIEQELERAGHLAPELAYA